MAREAKGKMLQYMGPLRGGSVVPCGGSVIAFLPENEYASARPVPDDLAKTLLAQRYGGRRLYREVTVRTERTGKRTVTPVVARQKPEPPKQEAPAAQTEGGKE